MRRRVSAVTSQDLLTFFKGKRGDGSDRWKSEVDKDGDFWARCNAYTVFASPKVAVYKVHIEAIDDATDSDTKVTDDPLEFIVEFLETGSEGDGFFRSRLSMTPERMSDVLRNLAGSVSRETIGPRRLSSALRRAITAADIHAFSEKQARGQNEDESVVAELLKLLRDVKSKGWKGSIARENDSPVLMIEIGSQYISTVTLDRVIWDYSFSVVGRPETKSSGVADDPIAEFRNYRRLEAVKEAREEAEYEAVPAGVKFNAPPPQVDDSATMPARALMR